MILNNNHFEKMLSYKRTRIKKKTNHSIKSFDFFWCFIEGSKIDIISNWNKRETQCYEAERFHLIIVNHFDRSSMFTKSISMAANQNDLEKKTDWVIFFFCSMRKIFQFDYMFEANWGEWLTTKWSHKIIETESIQIEYHLELYTLHQKKK